MRHARRWQTAESRRRPCETSNIFNRRSPKTINNNITEKKNPYTDRSPRGIRSVCIIGAFAGRRGGSIYILYCYILCCWWITVYMYCIYIYMSLLFRCDLEQKLWIDEDILFMIYNIILIYAACITRTIYKYKCI